MNRDELTMIPFVDHLVYAVPNLVEGIAGIERLFGCDVVPGGRHESWGTANALVSLGESCYLEIIGPDPETSIDGTPTLFGIDVLKAPKLVTWAAKGDDLERIIRRASLAGVDLGSVSSGGRELPDGSALSWRFTDPFAERADGVVPFFIDWADTTHPATLLPRECHLLEVSVTHPDAIEVETALSAIGVPLSVTAGDVEITATIQTPNGTVELA